MTMIRGNVYRKTDLGTSCQPEWPISEVLQDLVDDPGTNVGRRIAFQEPVQEWSSGGVSVAPEYLPLVSGQNIFEVTPFPVVHGSFSFRLYLCLRHLRARVVSAGCQGLAQDS